MNVGGLQRQQLNFWTTSELDNQTDELMKAKLNIIEQNQKFMKFLQTDIPELIDVWLVKRHSPELVSNWSSATYDRFVLPVIEFVLNPDQTNCQMDYEEYKVGSELYKIYGLVNRSH